MKINRTLPPLDKNEYDVVVPTTTGEGFMINILIRQGSATFNGYRRSLDGSKGCAESSQVIKGGVEDKIVAVDGVLLKNKISTEIRTIFCDSGKNEFAIMRCCSIRLSKKDQITPICVLAMTPLQQDHRTSQQEKQPSQELQKDEDRFLNSDVVQAVLPDKEEIMTKKLSYSMEKH